MMALIMSLIIIMVSFFSFRQFAISSERKHIQSVAEIVGISLTQSMQLNYISNREAFLLRIADVEGLHQVRVVRSDNLSKQFGKGLSIEQAKDEIEAKVMQNNQPYYELIQKDGIPFFRGTIPYVATSNGNNNCLQCHEVPQGTVLGAITVLMSMSEMMHSAYTTLSVMVLVIVSSMLLIQLFFLRLVKPVITTVRNVQEAVECAIQGNFLTNIECHTNDEFGQVAVDLNRLLKYINNGLTTISQDVDQLMQQTSEHEHEQVNLLNSTISRVAGLIEAAQFKQAIEEDETKPEIYRRLSSVLQERFCINNFSVYEFVSNTNRMNTLVVDGEADAPCRWCNPQILVHAESCRAKRTGHVINSINSPGICYAFAPPADAQDRVHVCIPVIQSGAVGSVLQLVMHKNDAERVHKFLPYLNVYLREAAPVIEAKRLMDTLRATNLIDAMTGLHNRRFLEEFIETLVSSNQRRKSQLSVLMLDLDYFKMVNDTYGHDAGDLVIKALAKTMQASVRSSDLVIRFGGEEFLIIMQDTSGEAADAVAEKIRAAVETLKVQLPGAVLQKTISIGIAEFPLDSNIFWRVVKYADVAMYNAKEAGRNRVVRFCPEMWKDNFEY